MSLECAECERDLRAGHDPACSRYRIERAIAEDEEKERQLRRQSGGLLPICGTAVLIPEGSPRTVPVDKPS